MAVNHWVRTVQSLLEWASGNSLITRVPQGGTLLRTHFGWGFYGDISTAADLWLTATNLMVMGLVTTVGDGTEAPPDARLQASDQDPPSQRWIYWEGRAPRIASIDDGLQLVTWQDSGAQEAVDTKSMVSAKTVPSGETLGVWASWNPAAGWDTSGQVNLWYYASCLYSTPE
jgi:hypothetical protein